MRIQELFVGEDLRASPKVIVLTDFLPGVPSDVLATDVLFPATFDRSVWPTEEDLVEGPLKAPAERRNILELSPLRPCTDSKERSCWRLCLSLVSDRGSLVRSVKEACEVNAIPHADRQPAGWTRLGYDVLDASLTMSGLLNCGGSAQDAAWQVLRRRKERLTKYYLWPTVAVAEEFAAAIRDLVPEHAPFEVVGLYLCES